MNIPIDFVVYPIQDGTDLYKSARVSGVSPITPSCGLVIDLTDDISLKLSNEVVYDATASCFFAHAYLWCPRHVTLSELMRAFAQTRFCVSCTPHTKANSLSHKD